MKRKKIHWDTESFFSLIEVNHRVQLPKPLEHWQVILDNLSKKKYDFEMNSNKKAEKYKAEEENEYQTEEFLYFLNKMGRIVSKVDDVENINEKVNIMLVSSLLQVGGECLASGKILKEMKNHFKKMNCTEEERNFLKRIGETLNAESDYLESLQFLQDVFDDSKSGDIVISILHKDLLSKELKLSKNLCRTLIRDINKGKRLGNHLGFQCII